MNELRARFVGYRIWWLKWAVFTLSGAIAGLAGGLFAMAQESAYPDVMSLHASGLVVMMVLIGGGFVSFWGPVVGVIVYFVARDRARRRDRDLAVLVRPDVHGRGDLRTRGRRRCMGQADAPSSPDRGGGTGARGMTAPLFEVAHLHKRFGASGGAGGHQPRLRRGYGQWHHGAERRRQDHLFQRADRALPARPRPGDLRRRRRHRSAPGTDRRSRHRALVPDHEPLRRIHRPGKRHGRASRVRAGLFRAFWDLRDDATSRDEALAVLEQIGLAGRAGVRAADLPYGERRALEIAVALAAEPRIVFLDEPTSGPRRRGHGTVWPS